jgi:hypothetical protein
LKQQEPLFVKYVDKLVSRLRSTIENDPHEKLDMVRLYNFTTFDVMGDLTFGEPLHMLDRAEYDPWVSVIFTSLKVASYLSVMMSYPWLWRAFKKYVPESVNRRRMDHFNHSVTRVTKRLEKGRDVEGVDLWDLVLSQKEGRGLTRGEMDSNASLFMIAGTETTATLVSGLTYLLLRNPDCMAKLNDEIRSAFASDADMTMEQLAALPYLSACIKEAFRLYPPVPIGMPRLTPQDGSTIVGNMPCILLSRTLRGHSSFFRRGGWVMPSSMPIRGSVSSPSLLARGIVLAKSKLYMRIRFIHGYELIVALAWHTTRCASSSPRSCTTLIWNSAPRAGTGLSRRRIFFGRSIL